MGFFDGVLICTDLDGTLLDENRQISRENQEAIAHFKAEGGKFTFVTGRLPCTAKRQWEMVRPNAPFGCGNGAAIYDYESGAYIWCQTLPEEAAQLAEAVRQAVPGVGIQYYSPDRVYFASENHLMAGMRARNGLPNLVCECARFPEQVIKILFGCEAELVPAVEQILKQHPLADRFDFIRSEPTLFELLPKGACKGAVLPRLAEHLGISPRKIVAVGDYYNDVSMLQQAGLGIAVENAVPEVKAAADHVTVSNRQHAIARIIRDLEQGILKLD